MKTKLFVALSSLMLGLASCSGLEKIRQSLTKTSSQASSPQQASAPQESSDSGGVVLASNTAKGPDVLGIQIGMPMANAIRVVQQFGGPKAGRVSESGTPPWEKQNISAFSTDGTETLSVQAIKVDGRFLVLSVTREMRRNLVVEDTWEGLQKKYGKPSAASRDNRTFHTSLWVFDANGQAISAMPSTPECADATKTILEKQMIVPGLASTQCPEMSIGIIASLRPKYDNPTMAEMLKLNMFGYGLNQQRHEAGWASQKQQKQQQQQQDLEKAKQNPTKF